MELLRIKARWTMKFILKVSTIIYSAVQSIWIHIQDPNRIFRGSFEICKLKDISKNSTKISL